jgi:hypothetical protein
MRDLITELRASRPGAFAFGRVMSDVVGKNGTITRNAYQLHNSSIRPVWDMEEQLRYWPEVQVEPSAAAAALLAVPEVRTGKLYGKRLKPITLDAWLLARAWLREFRRLLVQASEHTKLAAPEIKRCDKLERMLDDIALSSGRGRRERVREPLDAAGAAAGRS